MIHDLPFPIVLSIIVIGSYYIVDQAVQSKL